MRLPADETSESESDGRPDPMEEDESDDSRGEEESTEQSESDESSDDENDDQHASVENVVADERGAGSLVGVMQNQKESVKLAFEIVSCDGNSHPLILGGNYGPTYAVQNLLQNDRSVFCSVKNSNVHILMKFAPSYYSSDAYFSLSSIIIKAPSERFSAPCKEGVLFVSDQPIDPEKTRMFNDVTKDKFEELQRRKFKDLDPLIRPVCFFRTTQGSNYITKIHFARLEKGRYVLLKLLRPHLTNSFVPITNIDLQYVGLRGFHGKSCVVYGNLN